MFSGGIDMDAGLEKQVASMADPASLGGQEDADLVAAQNKVALVKQHTVYTLIIYGFKKCVSQIWIVSSVHLSINCVDDPFIYIVIVCWRPSYLFPRAGLERSTGQKETC